MMCATEKMAFCRCNAPLCIFSPISSSLPGLLNLVEDAGVLARDPPHLQTLRGSSSGPTWTRPRLSPLAPPRPVNSAVQVESTSGGPSF